RCAPAAVSGRRDPRIRRTVGARLPRPRMSRNERRRLPHRQQALVLLPRPPRRWPLLRRLSRAADVPALPQDGGRADAAAVAPPFARPRGLGLAEPDLPRRRRARAPLPPAAGAPGDAA